MKKFSILFLLLLAVLLAIPGLVGTRAASHYQQLVDRIKANGAEVVSHRFHQGWFSSEAETQFAIPLPKAGAVGKGGSTIQRMTLVSTITHGPLTESGIGIAEVESDLQLDGAPLFPPGYPALIKTFISVDGSGETRVDLPAADIPAAGERPRMRFQGMQGELLFAADLQQVDLRITAAGLVMEKGGRRLLDLGSLTIESHTRQGIDGLTLGSGLLEVGRLELVDDGDGTVIRLEGIGIEAESSAEDSSVRMSVVYRFALASVDGEAYGPGTIGLAVEHLPAGVLVKLQQTLDGIRRQPLSEVERQVAVMNTLVGVSGALLEGNPKLTIEPLHLQTGEGVVEGHLSIQPVGVQLADSKDLMKLLNKLVAKASLRMPETLYRTLFRQQIELQLSQQLGEGDQLPSDPEWQQRIQAAADRKVDQLLQQEVLVREGDRLVTEADLSDGLLSVNGKMIPLPGATQ